MSFDRTELLLGFGAIVLVCVGIFTAKIATERWFPNEFESALASVLGCVGEQKTEAHDAICARPAVKALLALKSGAMVMDALSTRLTPQQCHYIGHVVGQQSYIQYQDIEFAVSRCNRACDSACVHGVIGEAFAEKLGYTDLDSDLDLKHLSPGQLRKVGRELCANSQTCHGVGHTLFQGYQDLAPSLSACRDIAPESLFPYCVNGVFMEYTDILSSKNMRSVSAVVFPEPKALDTLCEWPSLDEVRACFRYFPRILITTLEAAGLSRIEAYDRLQAICESYKQEYKRIACMAGIGAYNSYSIISDQRAASRSCRILPRLQDTAACYLGEVWVATQDRRTTLVPYCSKLPTPFQAVCFQSFFFFFIKGGGSVEDAEKLCADDNVLCKKGLKDHALDAWEQVRKNFRT